MRIARPNRAEYMPTHCYLRTEEIQFPNRYFSFSVFLEHQTMDKVQKLSRQSSL